MTTIPLLLALLAMTPCDKIIIKATISQGQHQVVGHSQCVTSHKQPPTVENYLQWLNDQETKALNDVNMPWVYPDGYQPGEMLINDAGDSHSHHFVTTLPRRAGTLGRTGQVSNLLGGWHPSYTNHARLERQLFEYQIEVPSHQAILLGDQLHKPGPRRVIKGSFQGRHLPLLLARGFRIWSKGNVKVVQPLVSPSTKVSKHTPYGLQDLAQPQSEEREKELLKTIEMFWSALPELQAPERPSIYVIGTARKSLVEPFDGGALISDRAFQVLKWERLRRFHRNTLWRYIAQHALAQIIENRESAEDVLWVTDAVAAGLRDLVYHRTYGDREWAADVLAKFAVIPEIDALIHAPQVALASTYFLAVDETTGLDTELNRFGNPDAPGKLFAEKLNDRFGTEAITEFLLEYLRGKERFLDAAKHKLSAQPNPLQGLLPWRSMPYPAMDYYIASVETQAGKTSVSVGQHGKSKAQDTITIELQSEGQTARQSRIGPGDVTFESGSNVEQVVIDPEARLVEHRHAPGEESRFNNYLNSRWRFLLNNISGLFAVTNKDLSLAADFSLREIYDQTYRYRFSLHYTPSSIGGSGGLTYAFGPELTPLRLSHALSIRGAYSYLRDEGIGLATGHLGSVRLAYSHDTRISPYFAFSGHGWNAGVTGGYHQTTDGKGTYANLGASIYGILELPGRQGLLGRLRADAMVGTPPEQATLRLGGIYRGSRGYESDAARSDIFRTIATLEHRHAFFTGARINFWGGLMWTRMEGAFFANATFLPGHDTDCASPVFYDVGYGLRFIGDVLNISPAAIVLDVGLPLNPCAKRSEHQPVTVYLSFLQSLSGF